MTRNDYAFRPSDFDIPVFLTELRRWVEIESPSTDRVAVNRMADHICAYAIGRGLMVERFATGDEWGDMVIVRNDDYRVGDPVLLAHMDTVHPVGTLDNVFGWREEGDHIYGPGIYDMKSGALMAIEAAARVTGRAGAMIIFTPDEETGTLAGRRFVEQYAHGARAALVMEPAREGGKIVTARRGGANYAIRVIGLMAHSGTRPQDGRSAIIEAAHLVLRLEALNDPVQGIGVNVGVIHGGTARNIVPGECVLDVDVRLPTLAVQEHVLAAIEALQPQGADIRYEIHGVVSRPPFAQSDAVGDLLNIAGPIASAMGYPLVAMASGGGSDGNFTAAIGVPTLDGLGPDGAQAHTVEEHIFPSSIAPRLAMLTNLLIELAERLARGIPPRAKPYQSCAMTVISSLPGIINAASTVERTGRGSWKNGA